MSSFVWASPRKAYEYYLDAAGRTHADLWHAVHDGHVRVSIMDVEFSGDQARALLTLLHWNSAESGRVFELPLWMAVHVDDVERSLCGTSLPSYRSGRPRKTRVEANRDYKLAVEVSKMLATRQATSVAEAARILIASGSVDGASPEAKMKRIQRAYAVYFRHD